MQRAGNGRRGEREYVGLELELLETLLVLHAKAVLFVDDDEPQPLEGDVGAEQPMRSDHDVDASLGELREDGRLLLRRLESTEHRDAHGEVRQTLTEGARVLIGENRRRHENGDLSLR